MDGVNVVTRLAESSPVIVGVLLVACWLLWKKLDVKDAYIAQRDSRMLEIHIEMNRVVSDNTAAIRELRDAISENKQH